MSLWNLYSWMFYLLTGRRNKLKRIPILKKQLATSGLFHGKLVVGVFGTHKGAGVTHFCLLLAQYASQYLGYKTAYIECYPGNDIRFLQEQQIDEMSIKKEFFCRQGVTYYPCVSEKRISEIMGDPYEFLILDLGSDFINGKSEFFRCDRKIVITSLTLWKRQELNRFRMNTEHVKNNNQWFYMAPFVSEKEIRLCFKELDINICGIPFQPNPLVLTAAVIHFFQKVLK